MSSSLKMAKLRTFNDFFEQILPPYGVSFASLKHEFCYLMAGVLVTSSIKQNAVQKSVAFFRGEGGVVLL